MSLKKNLKSKLPEAIICDLDGTLALYGDRNPYDRDFTKDDINVPVGRLVLKYIGGSTQVIFVSGRKDIYRDQTEQWLKDNGFLYYGELLFMRKTQPKGKQEPKDVLVKQEIYENEIKNKYNVLFVLDDRNQVVDFWRSQGLTCFQVAEGNF